MNRVNTFRLAGDLSFSRATRSAGIVLCLISGFDHLGLFLKYYDFPVFLLYIALIIKINWNCIHNDFCLSSVLSPTASTKAIGTDSTPAWSNVSMEPKAKIGTVYGRPKNAKAYSLTLRSLPFSFWRRSMLKIVNKIRNWDFLLNKTYLRN